MKNKKRKAKIRLLGHRLDYLEVKIARHEDMLTKHWATLDLHSGLLSLKPIQQKETK
jgi:hypothetical protein